MILPHRFITLGLDISDYKLRLVVLRYGYRKPQLIAFGETELTPGILENGIIQQPQSLITALKQLVKQAKGIHFRERTVRVGLPEQQSFITSITANDIPKEHLVKEALRNIPFEENEMYYDTQIAPTSKMITIAAGRKDFIDHYLQILEAADFKPIGLYVEAHALTKALCSNHTTSGVLIIDIGLARSTVVFYLNNAVYFTTSYPSVIDTQGVVQEHLQGVIDQTLRYYQSHYSKVASLQHIILCGSGAHLPNIQEFVSAISTIPTTLGNPLQALRPVKLNKKVPNVLGFSTAIGLALI